MSELTPEVSAALKLTGTFKPVADMLESSPPKVTLTEEEYTALMRIRDAFAEEHKPPEPELRPGVYRCRWNSWDTLLLVRSTSAFESGCFRYVLQRVDGPERDPFDSIPSTVTDIVPIDEPWRRWATKIRDMRERTVSEILNDNWPSIAAELDALLKQETP